MIVSMLTTVDNPFDPFMDFDRWYAYDMRAGYNTTGLLAAVVRDSDELSDPDNSLAIEQAIDEIVTLNVSGMHKKVSRDATASSSGPDSGP